ncbi:sensor histidine kinase [Cohnella terricola]|uniref:histidine kinase n=1 Tax=Cohnella terricola TaxID=1289167 RepID=A0A559JT65_9BACL|nr:HAMP domain-containing sensor histidine kinase [Cohnella terricola]TVY03069.1 hypothetical protein FPZ45_04050 [Cohnella terricola]
MEKNDIIMLIFFINRLGNGWEMTKNLFLDFLDILFPILLYQFVLLTKSSIKRSSITNQILLGLLCGTAILLSMVLPSVIENDFNDDLRNIPLIVSLLYGGFISGVVSFVCLALCRLFIEVDGSFAQVAAAAIVFVVASCFNPRFLKRKPANRIIITICLLIFSWLTSLLSAIYLNQANEFTDLMIVQVSLIQLAAMMMTVFLMEVTLKTTTMQEHLLHTEKLSLASHLASSVAHELRTPLTVIKGFIQLSLKNSEGKTKAYLENAKSELNRVEYTLSDFLNYAKPQLEHIEDFAISDMFNQMMEPIYQLSQMKDVRLEIHSDDDLWIRVDRLKFVQAITNIAKNAIEASNSHSGTVSIQAFKGSDSDVCIKIIDNGCGMSEDELDKLGTPFYSTQNNGTGLGLMVSFKIIKAFNGKIEYKSKKGKGTEALIWLPSINQVS